MKTEAAPARPSLELRPELTPPPERIQRLPVFRGYPVPWFVAMVNGEPEFRVAHGIRWKMAVETKRCWVCGERLGAYLAFVLGPMCGITRSTTEPACHRECATWSILNCPFLSRAHMTRRENDLPEGFQEPAGIMLKRNPGVSLLWMTKSFEPFSDHKGRWMLRVGDPVEVEFYFEGRAATRAEIDRSIEGGLPNLQHLAKQDGPEAEAALAEQIKRFEALLPGEEQQ